LSCVHHVDIEDLIDDIEVDHKVTDVEEINDYVYDVLTSAVLDVDLPSGWLLIGLRDPESDGTFECKYGLVDFSGLRNK
jgi:hypothetical protein